jgi:hypothetical protein
VPEDRIDFISAYCDRWCERCAFTERCSVFAVKVAESPSADGLGHFRRAGERGFPDATAFVRPGFDSL